MAANWNPVGFHGRSDRRYQSGDAATRLETEMTTVRARSDSPEATAVGDNKLTYNGRTRVARTADGVEIVQGLRVFTNNLERGTVDLSRATWEWHGPEGVYHLWFDVVLESDYKGNPASGRAMQSDDRVATRFEGKSA